MKDTTPNTSTTAPPPPPTTASATTTATTTTTPTTSATPTSPTSNKEKPAANTVFRDTRAELAQLLKKKEEIEVCSNDFIFQEKKSNLCSRNLYRTLKNKFMHLKLVI